MKAQITATAAALFAASAGADNLYGDFGKANPDLNGTGPAAARVVVVGSGPATASFDMHHGLSDGNPDLSQVNQAPDPSARRGSGGGFDMHQGISEGNPDLSPAPHI
ncbi:MAG: hypothetical protein WAT23_20655 [Chromatiaceae bacterium]